jgi:hypothetical protein
MVNSDTLLILRFYRLIQTQTIHDLWSDNPNCALFSCTFNITTSSEERGYIYLTLQVGLDTLESFLDIFSSSSPLPDALCLVVTFL